ncbi:MAG: methylenetetrahydrofolate reductase [Clostridia bacterium]|nr:methylenetetrahydrofolate reductase [Clostridia bacterium]
MKISEIISAKKPSLSFEVFPPKTSDNFSSVMSACEEIAKLSPSYMSVTYGAGGGTSAYTAEIAENLQRLGVTPLAHLSCISSTHERVRELLTDLRSRGVENILALRGDKTAEWSEARAQYKYASELVSEIKKFGGFCIGGACYPEGHPESASGAADIDALKIKVDAGCEFLTTQMFFDNNILYNFLYRLMRAGVNVPVVAGIMPVTSAAQIKRITSISGNTLPQRFIRLVDRYGDSPLAMKQAGIAYATEQIIDLYANGINAVHVYSMNKPDVAAAIRASVSAIIEG